MISVSALVLVSVPVIWFLAEKASKTIKNNAVFSPQEAMNPLGWDVQLQQRESAYRASIQMQIQQLQQDAELARKFDEIHQKYHQLNSELLRDFESQLSVDVPSSMNKARDMVSQTVESIAGRGVFKIFIDATFRKKSFEERVNNEQKKFQEQFEELIFEELIKEAYESQLEHLKKYNHRLEENINQYLCELVQVASLSPKLNPDNLLPGQFPEDAQFNQIIQIAQNVINDIIGLPAGPALVASIRTLSDSWKTNFGKAIPKFPHHFLQSLKLDFIYPRKLLFSPRKLFLKSLKGFSRFGILAVADGPLPIGDIIGAGLLLKDIKVGIYKLKYETPREMKDNLLKIVNAYEHELFDKCAGQAHVLQYEWLNIQSEIVMKTR